MRIFIQSTSPEELRKSWETGLMDGVTLSLTELAGGKIVAEIKAQLDEIVREFTVPICVPVPALSGAEIYRDARELARASDHVIVQVPFMEDAVVPVRKLIAEGIRVCLTHVYNGTQAFLAAKLGASMVSIPVDDLEAHGQRGSQVVGEIREVIDRADMECDVAVSAASSSAHFTECLLAGANVMCMTPAILRSLMMHALTERGVDRFLRDVSRRRKPRSS